MRSSRFYYYNDRTAETSWQKPKAIILPLSKFQLGQTGELRTKTVSSPKNEHKSNQLRLNSVGEVILKRDSSTQTHLTNRVCFNAATQTNEDESFSFSSYIDQFEQMTGRSNKSNLSNKSNFSNKSSSNSCFDTNCSKSNCTSLKHYLMNEAKFAGVYDDKQYWHKNNEVSDEDERDRKRRLASRYRDDPACSGDSSSTDQDADDEDANDSDYFAQQDRESLEDEEEYDEETNDDDMSNDNLDEDSSYSDDDLADYFKNGDNLGLETKVRLQRMLSAQLEKRKRMSRNRSAFKESKFDQFDDDDEEVLNSINRFINNKSKKDPNDLLETSSFIFLNKSATFDSTDDLETTSKAPAPLKRGSSKRAGELDSDQSLDLPDHQATKSSLNGSHRMIVLPNASAIADKAEVIDPSRNLRDTLVSVSDLLRKELPRKPKKDAKKSEKKAKDDKNKPKPPKRGNSLDSGSLAKPVKKKADEKKAAKNAQKNEELEKFAKENIKRHLKKGGLNSVFKRKESLKGMLVWTKSSIKQPMIATLLNDNELKQEAINCFQLIQTYCGDRELKPSELSRTNTLNDSLNSGGGLAKSLSSSDGLIKDALQSKEIAFKLIDCAITRGTNIKDEIFVQLCRQTTENPNETR